MRGPVARLALGVLVGGLLLGARARPVLATPPAWEQDLLRETDEQDEAIEQAKRAKTMGAVVQRYASRASRDPSALNHFLLGRVLFHNQDTGGARVQMKAALEEDAGFWPAHVRLAMLAVSTQDWSGAAEHLDAALARSPHDGEALRLAARVAAQRSDWAAAVGHLSVRVADDPSDLDARRLLAAMQFERKDYAAAIREIEVVRTRVRDDPRDRAFLAQALTASGRVDDAVALLEAALAKDPKDLSALDGLRSLYARKRDAASLRSVLERMLPLVPPETQPIVAKELEQVRALQEGRASATDAPADALPSIEEITVAAQSQDVQRRRDALRLVYEACELGYLKRVPRAILLRIQESVEPDAECRAWVVKTAGLIPSALPLLGSVGLYDSATSVRYLAEEELGDSGQAIVLAYLRPTLMDPAISLDELNVVRAALASLTGFRDLPPGVSRVSTAEDAAAVREAWRRWHLSDESTATKLAAIRQVKSFDVTQPERLLFDFVFDPSFDVMREAYVTLREAAARAPVLPMEKKVLPLFPRRTDDQVTRASMREIQEAVAAWRRTWDAERRAAMRGG